jgi:hypothetical protein
LGLTCANTSKTAIIASEAVAVVLQLCNKVTLVAKFIAEVSRRTLALR